MADIYTTVRSRDNLSPRSDLPRVGYTSWGRRTRAEMIAEMRRYYERQMEEAQFVLNAPDEEFIVETHTNLYSRRDVREVTE